ncbi:hypothetical protein [Microbulbifer sp.]|uniref:hypothetical protein n=1 Tax=Microbulbifer sp. TaxID=1908541 RepID=UPI002589E074|nr:hypothetical protein [Microbulbifer sp.]
MLKTLFLKGRKQLFKLASSKKVRLCTDFILLAASGYLMLKKAFGLSISSWLLENALQQPLVDVYYVGAYIFLVVAILSKGLILYFDHFPAVSHGLVEPDEISSCLQLMNNEICSHLDKCSTSEPAYISGLCEQHGYKGNLALIISSMAEHVRKSISNIRVKKKDLFISLYRYDSGNSELVYVLHYDPGRDLVESKRIDLSSAKYSRYESVKCMNSSGTTAYVLDARSDYVRGASKRHRSIKHYMGCKVCTETEIYGFLNVEFHHNPVFSDHEEMQDFMEEHVYPFKLLLEYQFLKKNFFATLGDFESNWRTG